MYKRKRRGKVMERKKEKEKQFLEYCILFYLYDADVKGRSK